MDIMTISFCFCIVLCVFMLIRNHFVHKFYMTLIEMISKRNRLSIAENKPWEWRYKEIPDQLKMVLQFWKPYSAFYDAKRLLGPDPDDV